MARTGDGRLPLIRSAAARLRNPATMQKSRAQDLEPLFLRLELDLRRPFDDARLPFEELRDEDFRLRLPDDELRALDELLRAADDEDLRPPDDDDLRPPREPEDLPLPGDDLTSASSMTPRQAPVSSSSISMYALKRWRSARTARLT